MKTQRSTRTRSSNIKPWRRLTASDKTTDVPGCAILSQSWGITISRSGYITSSSLLPVLPPDGIIGDYNLGATRRRMCLDTLFLVGGVYPPPRYPRTSNIRST
jgi:hypothetical protein